MLMEKVIRELRNATVIKITTHNKHGEKKSISEGLSYLEVDGLTVRIATEKTQSLDTGNSFSIVIAF